VTISVKKDFHHLLSDPMKKFRTRPQEGSNPMLPTMAHVLEMFNSVRWTLVALYVCFAFQFLMALAFMCTFIARFLTSDIDDV
jgi:tellurite resistance protein TehA-like permease